MVNTPEQNACANYISVLVLLVVLSLSILLSLLFDGNLLFCLLWWKVSVVQKLSRLMWQLLADNASRILRTIHAVQCNANFRRCTLHMHNSFLAMLRLLILLRAQFIISTTSTILIEDNLVVTPSNRRNCSVFLFDNFVTGTCYFDHYPCSSFSHFTMIIFTI